MLNKPCPDCHQSNTVTIKENHIECKNQSCSFSISYACPLCHQNLSEAIFNTDTYGSFFTCNGCHQKVHLRRIQYLIEGSMAVDHDTRCHICAGPTIHRSNANLGHRCFFFPKCSGQADLFNTTQETVVFLDFETTGLDSTRHHIIEIGALKIDKEGFEHIFESFIRPPRSISEKITSITGITNEMVANANTVDVVLPKLIDFIGNARLIAHNAEFDVPWLLINCHRLNLDHQIKDIVCTLKWAKNAKEPSASLGKLTKKYQITHENAHRALADAASTKELYFIYEKQKPDNKIIEPISTYTNIATKQLNHFERTQKFNLKVTT